MSESRDFRVPPSDAELVIRAIADELKTMTREEFLRISVEAGIHTPDGKLTAFYRQADEPETPEQ